MRIKTYVPILISFLQYIEYDARSMPFIPIIVLTRILAAIVFGSNNTKFCFNVNLFIFAIISQFETQVMTYYG